MLRTEQFTIPSELARNFAARIEACREFPAVVSMEMPPLDPVLWLAAQSMDTRLLWSDRETRKVIAMVGEAAAVEAGTDEATADVIQRCRRLMASHHELRMYGGFSFGPQSSWPGFGHGRFVLPRFWLSDGQLHAVVLHRDDRVAAALDVQQLQESPLSQLPALPTPVETAHNPDHEGWLHNVRQALHLVNSEVLEKLVLARETNMVFNQPVDAISLIGKLAAATHDCFSFCFQFQRNPAFVGATPERLFKRSGRSLWSEIVAGTRPRGTTSGMDQRLAFELLTSDKDQLEHDIVRKSVRQRLHPVVDELIVDSHASVLRLAHKQHLCSRVEGSLKPGVGEGELLDCLHPTPAVGGYPTENALPEIERLETFNRGWYAAPVGWVGHDEAEFVVAIRSALVNGRQLSLFSGAGIVSGSDAQSEWDEVENKIRGFVDILAR